MPTARRVCFAAALVVCAVALGAQVDVTTLGPQKGQAAIEFRLNDQTGQPRTLASVAGPKGTMLVFFRSADW